jgi:hypothetical protein
MTHKFVNFNQEETFNIKKSSALTGGAGAGRDRPPTRWAGQGGVQSGGTGLGDRHVLPGAARGGGGAARYNNPVCFAATVHQQTRTMVAKSQSHGNVRFVQDAICNINIFYIHSIREYKRNLVGEKQGAQAVQVQQGAP